jgi:hypothetical protein
MATANECPARSGGTASFTVPAQARPALNDAALALGVPERDARHFACTGQMPVGDAWLLLQPLDPHPEGAWVAVVQRPRPAGVDEPAWLDTLLRANAQAMLAEDAAFALAENGDTVLVQRLQGAGNALLLSADLYGALLLSQSVQPDAAAAAPSQTCETGSW